MSYSKNNAKTILSRLYGWEDYGGHHLENYMTAFSYIYHNPLKFGIDQRNNLLAAQARIGTLSRDIALQQYRHGPKPPEFLIRYVLDRLEISPTEFDRIISMKNLTWKNFYSYKKRFEFMRPLFYLFVRLGRLPESFYLKYCFPIE